jgi:hypothetical protein
VVLRSDEFGQLDSGENRYPFITCSPREIEMARGERKSNRETKKPKKKKEIAAAPSQKPGGWQPSPVADKKK